MGFDEAKLVTSLIYRNFWLAQYDQRQEFVAVKKAKNRGTSVSYIA